MEQLKIDLSAYKHPSSSVFTGRPQGEDVRKKLNLDKLDKDTNKTIVFVLPAEITSFNPSFYLGLLYESVKRLGADTFSKKYVFELQNDDEEIKEVIKRNLDDGLRNAINAMNKNFGFDVFYNAK